MESAEKVDPEVTETVEDDYDGLEYGSLLFLVPASAVLTWWEDNTWLAWAAIVIGVLGVVLAVVTLVIQGRKGTIKNVWLVGFLVGGGVVRFISEGWHYLT